MPSDRAQQLAEEARREVDAIRGDFEDASKLLSLIDALAALSQGAADRAVAPPELFVSPCPKCPTPGQCKTTEKCK